MVWRVQKNREKGENAGAADCTLAEKKGARSRLTHNYLSDPAFDDRLGGEHPLPDGGQLHV